jgi:hypothetical protein
VRPLTEGGIPLLEQRPTTIVNVCSDVVGNLVTCGGGLSMVGA